MPRMLRTSGMAWRIARRASHIVMGLGLIRRMFGICTFGIWTFGIWMFGRVQLWKLAGLFRPGILASGPGRSTTRGARPGVLKTCREPTLKWTIEPLLRVLPGIA